MSKSSVVCDSTKYCINDLKIESGCCADYTLVTYDTDPNADQIRGREEFVMAGFKIEKGSHIKICVEAGTANQINEKVNETYKVDYIGATATAVCLGSMDKADVAMGTLNATTMTLYL